MKKMFSFIAGISLISSVALSTSACTKEVRINEYQSDPGFQSEAHILKSGTIFINFDYPDWTFHTLVIKENSNEQLLTKVKKFYGLDKDKMITKIHRITHIKYNYQLKTFKEKKDNGIVIKAIEDIKDIYILQ